MIQPAQRARPPGQVVGVVGVDSMASSSSISTPLEKARAALLEQGQRQNQIFRMIEGKQAELDQRIAARKGKGSGRLSVAEQKKEDDLNALLVNLRLGYLPGERVPTARAPTAQVFQSARQHSAHHAGGLSVPAGRPRNDGGRAGRGNNDGDAGDEGDGVDDVDGAECDAPDDGEADPAFTHFYRVPINQKAFNKWAAVQFVRNGANLSSATFRPKDVIKAGCNRKLIGVGACHVHAPHRYLGLPLPPCPKHGWSSVDRKRVKSKGTCPARRVYDDGIDEWVVGSLVLCGLCEDEHNELAEELRGLEEDGADEEEIKLLEAAVKAATYSFRSYNHESMKLYAERYGWYVLSLLIPGGVDKRV